MKTEKKIVAIMKKMLACAGVVACAGMQAAGAQPLDGMQLAKDNICMGCHQVEKVRVGPPFAAIADRYKAGGEQMVTYLSNSIRKGGRGRWGAVPMPAQPQVTEEEGQALAQWILSLGLASGIAKP